METLRSLDCGPAKTALPVLDLARVAHDAAGALNSHPNADALHAAALVGLAASDERGNAITQSISYLEMLTRIVPNSSAAFADLAAVKLLRAESPDGAPLLVESLEAASRAVELNPSLPEALFNRALAMDLLGLNDGAIRAWHRYLGIDSVSEYANEARQRIRANAAYGPVVPPGKGATVGDYVDFATTSPTEARAFALETLLPTWGRNFLAGDTASLLEALRFTSVIGQELVTRTHDRTVADALKDIRRSSSNRTRITRLATDFVLYARAQERVRVSDYAAADSAFLAILGTPVDARSPALSALAAYGHANAMIYGHQPVAALEAADSIAHHVSASRYPFVVALGEWNRGLLLLRAAKFDEGLEAVERSRSRLHTVAYDERAAAALGMRGEVLLNQLNRTVEGYAALARAAVDLRAYPRGLWRHNVLLTLARAATREGWSFAARALEDEDFDTIANGRPTSVVEAHLARARSDWASGRKPAADSALAAANAALDNVTDTNSRTQLHKELDLTIATRLLGTDPDSAQRLLDSTIAFFAPLNFPMKLIPSLLARSTLAIRRGDVTAARADLSRAAATYLAVRGELADASEQSSLLASAHEAFDALVMLDLSAGRTGRALQTLLEGRSALAGRAGDGELPTAARFHEMLAFALVGDTLLAWAASPHDTSFRRTIIRGVMLHGTIERLRSGMELGTAANVLRADLATLYELLIHPLEGSGDLPAQTLDLVADGELGAIPFAALWDSHHQKYLVQKYSVQFVPRAIRARSRDASRNGKTVAVFVGEPKPAGEMFAGLAALPDAANEVRDVGAEYAKPLILEGAAADSASIEAALKHATLFHFAGHAVFDDAMPYRSYLAVPPHGLAASSISTLDLTRLDLVVLSACETMRSPTDQAGGFLGLSDAFLAAGARGVIGATWPVEDRSTRALMRQFHGAYRESRDAAAALRAAQISMISARNTSPSVWAGFRYAGF